jgi:hypothetical protein
MLTQFHHYNIIANKNVLLLWEFNQNMEIFQQEQQSHKAKEDNKFNC